MKRKISLLIFCPLLCFQMICGQTRTISGTVKDRTGQTIPGAIIVIKGTTLGVVTDTDGFYTLEAPAKSVLIVSYTGYRTAEKKIGSKATVFNFMLSENVNFLSEVVITAIGIKQQKKKLGYTTQQVNTDALEQPGTINMGNALSGQIAGLIVNNPTGLFQKPTFQLRGKSPLMVVDGIPIQSDLFDISPENIDNINVLKGTAAAALYGSRGKDGAILITTKQARTEGLSVTGTLTSMVSAGFAVYPQVQSEYGSGSNGKYEFWNGADGGVFDGDMTWGPKFTPGLQIAQWNSPIRNKKTGETIPWYGDVTGTMYDNRSLYERVPIAWEAHDNLKDFLRTGVITKAAFSVANKGKYSSYNFTGDFASQRGQVPNTSVTTGGLNFNGTYAISNTVSFTSSLSYNKVYSPNYPRYGYGPRNHIYTILLWMGDDVNGKDLAKHHYRPDADGVIQANYNYAWYNNPWFATNELAQEHDRNTTNGQVKLNWDILPGLSLQARAAGRLESLFEDMESPKSYRSNEDSRNGDYKIWKKEKLDVNADLLATYSHTMNDNVAFTVNVGSSLFYQSLRNEHQSTDGLIVPRVYNMGNSLNPVRATNAKTEKAIESLYGSVNLDLFKSVFLTFTGRNDWSSTLSSANNSYFYPSVSVSTLVSDYLKLPSWVDYLKVNGAWAVVSSDLTPYELAATYRNGITYGSTPSVTYPNKTRNETVLLNPDILPQKTTSYEVGLSASFLKNRFGIDLTYYRMFDENSIILLPQSLASGYPYRLVNGNKYTTNGAELIVNATPVNNRNFSWSVITNWSTNVRKLTGIYGGKEKFGDLRKGDRADAMYAIEWQKTPDGQLILDKNSGLPTQSAYKTFIGNQDPNVRFGLQNSFSVKNFSVHIDVDGAIGGTLVSTTIQKLWWGGRHPKSTIYRQEEYDNNGKPVFVPEGVNVTGGEVSYDVNGNILSDSRTYQENATAVNIQTWAQNYPYRAVVKTSENKLFANTYSRSFLKLRRISVTYDLTSYLRSNAIKGLDVTLFGNNLGVIKKTPYLDPDFGAYDYDLQDPSARYIGISATIKL